ncbi:MAG: alpha-L-fucosidase [Candidatus Lokiarchaeota archaeon]|nr:alpha-L-fucosidase [Candidatus Lokiarchaeota archaeon]
MERIMEYEPTKKSIKKHTIPKWFHDAKFGIFIHWGLYSVPAFASTGRGDLIEVIKNEGWIGQFKNNPYAEWYLNSLKIEGSPTSEYHNEKYGEDFSYDDFAPIFNEKIKEWNPKEMAEIFRKVGAKYVVLGTKHHDGFLLWPSNHPNPNKENWHAERNIVAELTEAVKSRGMKMGFYYSGALDWTFNPEKTIKHVVDLLANGPTSKEYAEYVNSHYYELIDKFEPAILWNDIGYPPAANPFEIISYFYNKIKEGAINDRWSQVPKFIRPIIKFWPIKKIISWAAKKMMKGGSTGMKPPHYDFLTPEYTTLNKISKEKWETTRGIANSFGFNQFEQEEDHLTVKELVHLLIDVVSKNGNLLLNVGPMANGSIAEIQKERLLGLGKWLDKNGDGIFGSKPWKKAEGTTSEGIPIRYTKKNNNLYIFIFEKPANKKIIIESLKLKDNSSISLIEEEEELKWEQKNTDLMINLSKKLGESDAYVLKVTPLPNYIS